MDQIAQKHEVTPHIAHSFNTVAPGIEEGLQHRIRSLLHSRNERRLVRAPCPSPEFSVRSRTFYVESTSWSPSAKSFAQVPRSKMAMESFDESDSFSDTVSNNLAGKLSQPILCNGKPSIYTDSSPFVNPQHNESPTQNTIHNEVAPRNILQHAIPDSTKHRPEIHNLRYSLRVVPPRRTPTFDLQARPGAMHVPGSYQSYSNASEDRVPQPTERGQQCEHKGHGNGRLDLHESLGTLIEPLTSAVTALTQMKGQVTESPMQDRAHGDDIRMSEIADGGKLPAYEAKRSSSSPPSRSSSLSALQINTAETASEALAPTPLRTSNTMAQADRDEPTATTLSRAVSFLSEFYCRSRIGSKSSIPITTSHRRRSVVSPSETQYTATTSSKASVVRPRSQNFRRRSDGSPYPLGKRAATAAPSSSLTKRPSQHRNKKAARERLRARTMPTTENEKPSYRRAGTESPGEASKMHQDEKTGQAFSKAIDNLEDLLKEALTIAGKANSRETSEATPQASIVHEPPLSAEKPKSTDTSDDNDSSYSSSTSDSKAEKTKLLTDKSLQGGEPQSVVISGEHGVDIEQTIPVNPQLQVTSNQQKVPLGKDRDFKEGSAPVAVPVSLLKPAIDPLQFEQAPVKANDWAYVRNPSRPPPSIPNDPLPVRHSLKDDRHHLVRNEGLREQQRPPVIQPRSSSRKLDGFHQPDRDELNLLDHDSPSSDSEGAAYVADFKDDAKQYHPVYRDLSSEDEKVTSRPEAKRKPRREDKITSLQDKEIVMHSSRPTVQRNTSQNEVSLNNGHHFSIREPRGFSLRRSHRRRPIARDWSTGRKRFTAAVTCITTALLGLSLGIYAGEVPGIQYALADEHHYTILGNVVFFLGLATSTILFWPLPVLHGRKPYTLAALVIVLPLQFPQALAVNGLRSAYIATYRAGVLIPRGVSGFVMGFANINFLTTLLDLFGASLQSRNPHQEVVNENDVRRHGGGIGVWLGIWTWCSIMSIGVGFLIGALVLSSDDINDVPWGFWIAIILNAAVLLLNVIAPEVRRSPYRRSMAEVRTGSDISRRVARGEIKMHLDQTGPRYWYEELQAGYRLCFRMVKQPGFLVLALYQGWIYGQMVLLIAVCA